MPRSVTGANRGRGIRCSVPRRSAPAPVAPGFTLVEILVVVIIAAVLTGFALLALGRAGPAATHERAAARIEASMAVLCDRALLTGNAHGIRFHDSGYDFWVLRPSGWVELAADEPPSGRWPDTGTPRVRIASVRSEPGRASGPQVVCTGIEPATPFGLVFGQGESRRELVWP